jgi:hypothetical protein
VTRVPELFTIVAEDARVCVIAEENVVAAPAVLYVSVLKLRTNFGSKPRIASAEAVIATELRR